MILEAILTSHGRVPQHPEHPHPERLLSMGGGFRWLCVAHWVKQSEGGTATLHKYCGEVGDVWLDINALERMRICHKTEKNN